MDIEKTLPEGLVRANTGGASPHTVVACNELAGALDVVDPSDYTSLEMPDSVEAEIRLSWSPAHISVVFEHQEVWNNLSFRPHKNCHAVGSEVEYRRDNFDESVRKAPPLMFYNPSEVPKNASGHIDVPPVRNSRATTPSNTNAGGDGHDWSQWPADVWGQYSDED